jgi:hypothetical protein
MKLEIFICTRRADNVYLAGKYLPTRGPSLVRQQRRGRVFLTALLCIDYRRCNLYHALVHRGSLSSIPVEFICSDESQQIALSARRRRFCMQMNKKSAYTRARPTNQAAGRPAILSFLEVNIYN